MKLSPFFMAFILISTNALAANGKAQYQINIEDLDITSREEVKKCALIGNRFSAILDEMKQVDASYKGKCVSRAESMITGIQTDMTALQKLSDQSNTTVDGGTSDTATTQTMTPAQAEKLNTAMSQIGGLISERQCHEELKKSGFINILADTIQSITSVAMFVPSSNGLLITVGGGLISSALKAIQNIFASDFQWRDAKDQKAFLTFNCAYMDVRKKIRSEGVYNVLDKKLIGEINSTQEKIDSLKQFKYAKDSVMVSVEKLKLELNQEILKLKEKSAAETESKLAINKITPAKSSIDKGLAEIISSLSEVEGSENPSLEIAIALTIAQDILTNMQQNLLALSPEEVFFKALYNKSITSLEKLSSTNAMQLINMSGEQTKSLIKEISQAQSSFTAIAELQIYQAQSIVSKKSKKSEENLILKLTKNYEAQISDLIKSNPEKYTLELKAKNLRSGKSVELNNLLADKKSQMVSGGQERFSQTNLGTENEAEINNLNKKNANRIYGPVGHSFLEYLIAESQTALEDFENNLENTPIKNAFIDIEYRIAEDRLNHCTDLRKIKEVYAGSTFPSEMGYDFALTNLELFHSLNEKKFQFTDYRAELRGQAFTALYAKALIKKYHDINDHSIRNVHDLMNSAKELQYNTTVEECKKRRINKGKNRGKRMKVCSEVHQKVIFEDSIGMEMIKSTVAEEKLLKLQRHIAKTCKKY